jgi:CheY-like chemotaxis protein
MSGKIWVESEAGRGSTFHFTARFALQKGPANKAYLRDDASGSSATAARGPIRRRRQPLQILLVEDNTINQILAQRLIRKKGHTIIVANNGREALAALEKEQFDLILMDIQMPEMSGLEVTVEIRRREKQKGTGGHIPIIATTASVMREDRDRCFEAGMDAYIAKPIEREILYETIDRLTGCSNEAKPGDSGARTSNPVFDAGAVLDSLDGDSDLLRDIAVIFLAQCPKHLEKIRAAISKEDPKALESSAHAMKGMAANLLAHAVVEAASKLEEIGRTGSVTGSNNALALLEEELGKLQLALGYLEREYAQSRS